MREILFRGKSLRTEKWIQGYLFRCWECSYIAWGMVNDNSDMKEVDPETVCQYTGLTDKNGRKIFEGDIVKIGLEHYEVWWNCDSSSITLSSKNESRGLYLSHNETVEVIGNIFDNPELIGEHP